MYTAYIRRWETKTGKRDAKMVSGDMLKQVMEQIAILRRHNELDRYSPYEIVNVINTEEEECEECED